ncbi:O-antigen ligase family protein [Sphingomonas sp. 2378]|uniref:O-antigen ligase family protein n=1 Tax=Sphingomonas sp. 2378 TaxID=1219748 RepID=UPI00311B2167
MTSFMRSAASRHSVKWPALATLLLAAMLALATLTGGASFPDTLGQAVVRTGAMLLVAIAIGSAQRFDMRHYRGLGFILAAAVLIVLLQLVPLPPALWAALPGRTAFNIGVLVPETADAWRPAAIVPDGALNALFALIVPICTLLLVAAVPRRELKLIVPFLVAMVGLSSVLAAMQFAGSTFDNPFINERLGFASGLLANRNHQALFLSIGIVAALQWATTRPLLHWRVAASGITVIWFMLMILATGSRAGLMLGLLALLSGMVLVISVVRRAKLRMSRRTAFLVGVAGLLVCAGIVAASLYAGRSASLDRLTDAVIGDDMRIRALPVVLDMIRTYMPLGAGQGGFATLFAVVEPDRLLKPTYFNHAHNDFLELLIEAGIPGALLLLAALAWFARRVWIVWRHTPDGETLRARLGSIIITLVLLASFTDYPARTPIIMAVLVAAAALTVPPSLALPDERSTL